MDTGTSVVHNSRFILGFVPSDGDGHYSAAAAVSEPARDRRPAPLLVAGLMTHSDGVAASYSLALATRPGRAPSAFVAYSIAAER